jgi:V-type H+-transporting ATPase subunit C
LNFLTHFSQLAADEDFFLQTVTVFKKVRDEYTHKCRENKYVSALLHLCPVGMLTPARFIVRDFTWDDSALEKQKKEAADLAVEEKALHVSCPVCFHPW